MKFLHFRILNQTHFVIVSVSVQNDCLLGFIVCEEFTLICTGRSQLGNIYCDLKYREQTLTARNNRCARNYFGSGSNSLQKKLTEQVFLFEISREYFRTPQCFGNLLEGPHEPRQP